MAVRSLSQMRTRIIRKAYGPDDNEDTEIQQLVDDELNRSYQDICRRHNWGWMRKESIINTSATKSTGTISISGSQVTGVGTDFSAAMEGWYLQVEDLGDSTYRILDVTSSTSMTIEGPVSEAVSTSSYLAFKADYALPLGLDEGSIDLVIDTEESKKIEPLPHNLAEDYWPNFSGVSPVNLPNYFSIVGRDTDNQVLIRFYPVCEETRTFRIVGYDSVSDMSTGNDTPLIPEKYQEVIEEGTLARIFAWQGKNDLSKLHSGLYESYIRSMLQESLNRVGEIYPKEPNDIPKGPVSPTVKLPDEYGGKRF